MSGISNKGQDIWVFLLEEFGRLNRSCCRKEISRNGSRERRIHRLNHLRDTAKTRKSRASPSADCTRQEIERGKRTIRTSLLFWSFWHA